MNRSKKLFKNTIIYFLGNIGSKFLIFIMLPIYSIYLSPDDFGMVDLLLSLIPLLGPVVSCQISESVFRFLCSSKTLKIKKSIITTSFIFLLSILFILNIFLLYFVNFKFDILFYCYFTLSQFFLFFGQIARGLKYASIYAFSGIISAFLQATICILMIKEIGSSAIFLSGILGFLISFIVVVIKINFFSYINLKYINLKILKLILSFGLPLIPNQICWWFNNVAGKYIATYFNGFSIAGILAISTRLPSLIAVVNGIFLLSWTESLIEEFKSKDCSEYFSKAISYFIKFQFIILIFILPITKLYYLIFIDDYYLDSSRIVPLLYISGALTGISAFLGTIYTASLQTKKAFHTTIFPAISNIVISLVLIPKYNIFGLAVAMLISSLLFFIVRYNSCRKILNYKIYYNFFIYDIFIFIVSLSIFYLNNIYFIFLFGVFLYMLILFLNKKYIFIVKNILLNKKISSKNPNFT